MMSLKTAKKIINLARAGQHRNKNSKNRPVKQILIDEYDILNIYDNQNSLCYWSGLILDERFNYIKFHPFAISPERLDNTKDYTKDNVVLCRRLFNLGRINYPEEGFRHVMNVLTEEIKGNYDYSNFDKFIMNED